MSTVALKDVTKIWPDGTYAVTVRPLAEGEERHLPDRLRIRRGHGQDVDAAVRVCQLDARQVVGLAHGDQPEREGSLRSPREKREGIVDRRLGRVARRIDEDRRRVDARSDRHVAHDARLVEPVGAVSAGHWMALMATRYQHEYGLELTSWEDLPKADAVILAVAHKGFVEMSPAAIMEKIVDKGCLVQVKPALDPAAFRREGVRVWRL